MIQTPTTYRLKEIRGRQIILESPHGGVRVVSLDGMTPGSLTPQGVTLTTPQVVYCVSEQDFERIRPYITREA